MATVIEGNFTNAAGKKFAIVVARFNAFITEKLVEGALDTLKRHGVNDADISIVWVPGSFELPVVVKRLAEAKKHDAVIALGCVIRGATAHFDYVAGEAAKGIGQAAMSTGVPVIFGVLTTDSNEQAIERAVTKAGNKGADAAMAAIEMADLLGKI